MLVKCKFRNCGFLQKGIGLCRNPAVFITENGNCFNANPFVSETIEEKYKERLEFAEVDQKISETSSNEEQEGIPHD